MGVQTNLVVPLPNPEQFLAPHVNVAPSQGTLWGLSMRAMNHVKSREREKQREEDQAWLVQDSYQIPGPGHGPASQTERGGEKAVFSAAERTDHVRLVKKSE